MADYKEGSKREVAEVKFLIHDLRVERFINEIIHYHVTLDTDLEIFDVDPARAMHDPDLQQLKVRARQLRGAYHAYSGAVRNFSPDETVLLTGNAYIQAIYDTCELILNPLWGRIDQMLAFLPSDSRSVLSRSHYRNCIHWLCGVYYRIEHFWDERRGEDLDEEWELAEDLQDFTRNVVYGYVVEKSSARVELRLDEMEPAVVGGNRHRLRRMYFNLIMNAVDALGGRRLGMIHIRTRLEGDRVLLEVEDNGCGMPREKVQQLLSDKETLDGELHSLGFVFVRQTVDQFGGELEIDSEVGVGTTIRISLPHLPDAPPKRQPRSRCEKYELLMEGEGEGEGPRKLRIAEKRRAEVVKPPPPAEGGTSYGNELVSDYRTSDSPHPGSIFAIAVSEADRVEFFTHRPYERLWNMSHEDLSPMYFDATVRGRLEEDEAKKPVLVLKAPQNIREYFEFKEVEESERSSELYTAMVRHELVQIARVLIDTGMDGQIGVHLTDTRKFFPTSPELIDVEPFPLRALADQPSEVG